MPILKNVLGLDVGSHSVKAVEFRQSLRGIEAVQLRSMPRADHEMGLADLLRRFVTLHALPTQHVVCALPSGVTSSRHLSFPFSDRKRLAQAVPFEIEAELPFDLDEFLVDWELVASSPGRGDVVATIARRSGVSQLLELFTEAGCAPRTLETEGLVLANLASVFDLGGTRLLADVGHEKTTLCVLVDGRAALHRTLPVAGARLTDALSRDRRIVPAEAERLKCDEGVFDAAGNAGPATGAALSELAREMVRTLGAAEPLLHAAGSSGAVEVTLLGGSAKLDRLDSWLADRLGVPVARLGLPREDAAEGLAAGGDPLLFAPAIALGVRGTARARTRMNFRQDEFAVRVDLGRFRRDFRTTGWLAAALAVLAILDFGAATALEKMRVGAVEKQIADLYHGAFPGRAVPASAVSGLRDALRVANEKAEFLGVYAGNLSALDLLTEISRRVPADLDVVFEELTIDGQIVRIRVYSKNFGSSDRLSAELAKFAPFASVRVGSIETDRKTGGKRFNLTISLASADEGESA